MRAYVDLSEMPSMRKSIILAGKTAAMQRRDSYEQ